MARYSMENGHKATALFVLAIISQVAVIAIVAGVWWRPPQSGEITSIVVTALAFFQSTVAAVIGFFSGATRPDGKPKVLPPGGMP